jgi:hypothetical protein
VASPFRTTALLALVTTLAKNDLLPDGISLGQLQVVANLDTKYTGRNAFTAPFSPAELDGSSTPTKPQLAGTKSRLIGSRRACTITETVTSFFKRNWCAAVRTAPWLRFVLNL